MANQQQSDSESKYFLQQKDPRENRVSEVKKTNGVLLSKLKKQVPLPPIISPFLKKTVSNLFADANHVTNFAKGQYEVIDFSAMLKSHDSKSLKGAKIGNRKHPLLDEKMFHNQSEAISTKLSTKCKIVKSFSEVKHASEFLYGKIRNSEDAGLEELEIREMKRQSTEGSQQGIKRGHSLMKQLKRYSEKQYKVDRSEEKAPEKQVLKQAKPPNFVNKLKLSKQLYDSEREQIKIVKSLFKKEREQALTKLMQVKNYTKFIPKTIFINH